MWGTGHGYKAISLVPSPVTEPLGLRCNAPLHEIISVGRRLQPDSLTASWLMGNQELTRARRRYSYSFHSRACKLQMAGALQDEGFELVKLTGWPVRMTWVHNNHKHIRFNNKSSPKLQAKRIPKNPNN